MPAELPPIEAEDLGREFRSFRKRDRVTALDGLNLSVARGEVLGLLGPNGSGKSTTMKLLLGLLRPTSGRALLLGKPAGDRSALGRTGYLPEESRLFPFLTARETVSFFAGLAGVTGRARREATDRRLEEVGLSDARDRRVGGFSKGMGRRLGLACALVGDPEVLLFDEPTSGLDPLATAVVKDLIRSLKVAGTTILLSSHLLSDVEQICDRIAILGKGRLVREGSPDELLALQREFQIRYRGGDPELLERLRAFVVEGGGTVLSTGHPKEDLERLFLGIFEEP